MRARLNNTWLYVSTGLWFIPMLLATLAAFLAALTLFVDSSTHDLGGAAPYLFGGSASAARGLLATIAGSMITVVSLAFSITIVAVQQASTQFSPRVIRNFMRDRANQVVFGVYIATFVYALLVLRTVREQRDTGDEFVPALAVSVALLLALLCVALLIFYIHHTAASLQVATIADKIHRELQEGIDTLFPTAISVPVDAAAAIPPVNLQDPPAFTVRAASPGFIRVLEEEQLLEALGGPFLAARVRPRVGDYVFTGDPLVDLWTGGPREGEVAEAAERTEAAIRKAFALGRERSPAQDLLFSLSQLVDIALKALSPGINDPATAEECLSHLGDVVAQLAGRQFPDTWRRASQGGACLIFNQPDFTDVVRAAFDQIRREAAGDVHVTGYLLGVLEQIAPRAASDLQASAIQRQVAEVLEVLEHQGFSESDAAELRLHARHVLATLGRTNTAYISSK